MLFVYGTLMPARVLEEILQWKRQEKENMAFIPSVLPALEPQYTAWLNEWERLVHRTIHYTQFYIHPYRHTDRPFAPELQEQVDHLLNASLAHSLAWVTQLREVMAASPAIRCNIPAQQTLRRIIEQSESFIQTAQPMVHPGIAAPAFQEQSLFNSEDYRIKTWSDMLSPKQPEPVPIGGHQLPPLPYPYDALEPYIDETTMRIHHDKHHQAYVNGLNAAELALASAREDGNYDLIKYWSGELAFNGAGHDLHTLFWEIMNPEGGGKPEGDLAEQIIQDYGSFDQFKAQFSAAAEKVEGGGWAILIWSPRSGRTQILQAEKHQNLSQWDNIPLLSLDVWEHAYYLSYQNNRRKYIDCWWNVVYWPAVAARYKQARQLRWQPW